VSYVTVWFETPIATAAAAEELRKHGYQISPDEDNNPTCGLRVPYDSSDADTEGPEVILGADFDRIEALAAQFGGEVDTWTVSRLDERWSR
jgi:hypothetical protein